MRGSNHPKWNNGSSQRSHASKAAIEKIKKQRGRCEKCGSEEKLHGHHVSHYAKNDMRRDDPNNIKILCAQCHALEHPHLRRFILSH